MDIDKEIARYHERRGISPQPSHTPRVEFQRQGTFTVALMCATGAVGVAKCNSGCDTFNEEVGQRIALWRVLDSYYREAV